MHMSGKQFFNSSNAKEPEKIAFAQFQIMRCEFKSILDNKELIIYNSSSKAEDESHLRLP